MRSLLLLILLLLPLVASARNHPPEPVGDYVIYYDVLPTAFLEPQVAQAYSLVRSKGQGMVRVTVLKKLDDGTLQPVRARVSGQVSNLAGQMNGLGFREIEVGRGQGYSSVATFRFSHDDPLRFNLRVTYSPQFPAHELGFIDRLLME